MNAHVKPTETRNAMRCIPQSYDETGELINIRELLRLGRAQEALTRLELTMDRHHESWRARGA